MNAEQKYMDGLIADLDDARHRANELEEENAVLREKLKRAMLLLFTVIDVKTGKEADVSERCNGRVLSKNTRRGRAYGVKPLPRKYFKIVEFVRTEEIE